MRTIVLLLAAAVVGCGSSDTCAQNSASCQDAGPGSCTGQCTPLGLGFDVLLWSGAAGATPPECPSFANGGTDKGFLDAPPSKVTCSPPCSCEPSGNECFLPTTMTAASASCPAVGTAPFDAPNVWDGACSTMDPVGSAASLTVEPPTLAGQGTCAASVANAVAVEGGTTIAVTCQRLPSRFGDVSGKCPRDDEWCAYPNAPGFSVCTVGASGPGTCPPGWSVQHTFYFASCDCTCGAATGELCSTTVTAYQDSACSSQVGSVTVTSNDGPTCSNISPPSALGSKKATVTYTPGTCAPSLTPIASETLCCLSGGT
jgi:hypothetical protein